VRFFFVTLFFFFAPIILMFALRHLSFLLRVWLAFRRAGGENRGGDENIIDITPGKPQPASRLFIVLAVVAGIVCASLVWMRLGDTTEPAGSYVPAHIDAQGTLVPGRHLPE